jgi:hypothetical protein
MEGPKSRLLSQLPWWVGVSPLPVPCPDYSFSNTHAEDSNVTGPSLHLALAENNDYCKDHSPFVNCYANATPTQAYCKDEE